MGHVSLLIGVQTRGGATKIILLGFLFLSSGRFFFFSLAAGERAREARAGRTAGREEEGEGNAQQREQDERKARERQQEREVKSEREQGGQAGRSREGETRQRQAQVSWKRHTRAVRREKQRDERRRERQNDK